jgi:phosphate/phosphite/phosphonate ABC transporter binding protein
MTKHFSTYTRLIGLFFVICFSSSALAEDCYRGTLDKQYCDRNRDQVADLPLDPKDWVNPDTIIFSYTPVEDPAIYAKVWDGFIKHMSEVTGKKVVFFPVQSYAAQYEAMRSGRLHIAGVNTGGNPVAVSCAGLVPFAMMASKDGSYGYEMEIIVPTGSDIKSPSDIKGRTLALTSPTSNSGNKAPSALMKSEFGLVKDTDFKTVFSGKHDNSVLGIANKDYEVAHQTRLPRSTNRQPSRPPAMATPTISIRRSPPGSSRPFLPSNGKVRICRKSSRRKAGLLAYITNPTGTSFVKSTPLTASATTANSSLIQA